MSASSSDAVTQDVSKIKDLLIAWLPDTLGYDLDPPIRSTEKKTVSRGWHHPDTSRLLVPPAWLTEFLEQPTEYIVSFLVYIY